MAQFIIIIASALLIINTGSVSDRDDRPEQEFIRGSRTTFNTSGHPKSKGIDLTISYPNSWTPAEGNRPNVVHKFTSEGGRGREMMIIVTKSIPLPPEMTLTREDIEELLSPPHLRDMIPSEATLIGVTPTKIESEPAGILEYTITTDRAGVSLTPHSWTLVFIYDNTIVQIQFHVGGLTASNVHTNQRMEEFKPLFRLMANSIVLHNKWSNDETTTLNTTQHTHLTSTLPSNKGVTMIILPIIISIIITWSIGLLPSIIIRYAIFCRPINTKKASTISATFSILFFMAFAALSIALGERPGNGFVWVIIFFVSRWIMSRGYESSPIKSGTTGTASR